MWVVVSAQHPLEKIPCTEAKSRAPGLRKVVSARRKWVSEWNEGLPKEFLCVVIGKHWWVTSAWPKLLPVGPRPGHCPRQVTVFQERGRVLGDAGGSWSCWVCGNELSQYSRVMGPKGCKKDVWGQVVCKGRGWRCTMPGDEILGRQVDIAVGQGRAVILPPVWQNCTKALCALLADLSTSPSIPCPLLCLADGGITFVLCCDLCPFFQIQWFCSTSCPMLMPRLFTPVSSRVYCPLPSLPRFTATVPLGSSIAQSCVQQCPLQCLPTV